MILFLLSVDNIYFTSHPLACFHPHSLALDIHPCNFHHPQSFLGTVENMFDEEFLEKEKVRAISFVLRDRAHLWWIRVKTDKEENN